MLYESYYGNNPPTSVDVEYRYRYTVQTGQTTFAATYAVGLVDVFYNGSHLDPVEYAATDGAIVSVPTAKVGASVVIVSRKQVALVSGNTYVPGLSVDQLSTAPAAGSAMDGKVLVLTGSTPALVFYTGGLRYKAVGTAF